jgi:serine/threonine protein phosphatase 1
LPSNRVGRDFVVGDIGGAYDQLFHAMQSAGFDPYCDRLISIGHLLAGKGSLTSCIRFLRSPSVFAVLSNSEQDLLDLFDDGPPDDEAVEALAGLDYHGMSWLAGAGHQQRRQLVASMRMLPLAISIGDAGARTGYVHAGLPAGAGWEEFLAGLRHNEVRHVIAALRGVGRDDNWVEGVERVFVCYTPDWDLTHKGSNTSAVAPGPVPQLIKDMMEPPKLVESRKAE